MQTTDGSQDIEQSMSTMMDGFIDVLSRDDRTLSVDAYQSLANVLRQYEDIPEEEMLKERIPAFMKYIKRDLLRERSPDEPPIADTNLMTQALRLLIIFVWNKDYACLLSDESRTFVLDRSIHVLAEHTAPKNVVVHYLHLLAAQNFRPNLITGHRVARLLEALKAISEHYSGNSIISERLLVYQKLLDQARPTMKARAAVWVEEMLTAMTNNLKEIRIMAIDLGLKACSAFPASSSISAIVRITLAKELSNQKTFSSNMCHRLEKLITIRESGVQVPQIWTIVLSLCNNVDDHGRNGWGPRCDKWPQFKDWLNVIQKGFNCGETVIRQQTYQAWNRFIHIVQPHLASDHLLQMLVKPIAGKLEGNGGDSATKGTRTTAVSSYCTLLYYAFRPSATHEQYHRVWNEYIMKVMKSSFFEKSAANADIASRVLMALFWNSKRATKIWNDTRTLENTFLEPEELPTVDCKWIRSKARAILDVLRVLMRYSSWGASGKSERAHIAVAWVHFLKALRESSRKEIKPSSETIEAMLHLNTFLARSYLQLSEHVGEVRREKPRGLGIDQVRQLTVSAVTILGGDLVLAGLADKGHGLSKALVIYDALATQMTDANRNEDPTTEIFIECLRSFDTALAHDFMSEKVTMTNVGIDQLQERMGGLTVDQTVHVMVLLKRSICMLLKEDISTWKHQHDRHRQYPKMISAVLTVLAYLPADIVEEMDEILAALFSSSHTLVVEHTILMWNKHFGQWPGLRLGPMLSGAFNRLQDSDMGIFISGRPIQNQSIQRKPSPENRLPPTSSRSVSPHLGDEFVGAQPSPELGSQDFYEGAQEPQAATDSTPHVPASRPRSRHDDSQVHFVPIESSPLPQETESQSLTVHQKEVRDRQRSEPAVVFADLRSSPRPQTRTASQSESGFARKMASQSDRPTTPTLATNDDQGDMEIMASPTPRARHLMNRITDMEVPSSPPSIMGNNDRHDFISSPLPAVLVAAEGAVDLAMEQVDSVEEHNAMEIDEPEPAHITLGVGMLQTSLDNDLNQERVQTDTPNPLAAEQTNQTIVMIDSNVLPDGCLAQESDNRSAAELQEHPDVLPEIEGNDTEIEQDLPRPHNNLSSSLRPITINLASDSTTADGPENMGSSPTSHFRSDRDEIDILSASQLSHDLDQHVSLAAASEADEPTSAHLKTASETQDDDREPSQMKQRSRKRRGSSQKFTATKRRKSSRIHSQNQSHATEEDDSVYNTPGEMFDCIEVSPSQAVQAIAPSDLTEPVSTPKRPRGRPRKQPLNESGAAERSLVKMELVDGQGSVDAALPEYQHPGEDEQMLGGSIESNIQEAATAASTESAVRLNTEELVGAMHLDSSTPDIMASLQSVLDRLKSGKSRPIDLKQVDDLCFQIRFQAQVISQRPGT